MKAIASGVKVIVSAINSPWLTLVMAWVYILTGVTVMVRLFVWGLVPSGDILAMGVGLAFLSAGMYFLDLMATKPWWWFR